LFVYFVTHIHLLYIKQCTTPFSPTGNCNTFNYFWRLYEFVQ